MGPFVCAVEANLIHWVVVKESAAFIAGVLSKESRQLVPKRPGFLMGFKETFLKPRGWKGL